jgi:hypothetical protein
VEPGRCEGVRGYGTAALDARDPECVCPDGSKPGYVEKVIDLRQPGTPEAGEASLCPGPPLPLQ